jgi:hypothetical protein
MNRYYVMATVTIHSISIWFTVYLSLYRIIYLKVSSPNKKIKINSIINNYKNYILKLLSKKLTFLVMILISIVKSFKFFKSNIYLFIH